jgi:hypothetical protein
MVSPFSNLNFFKSSSSFSKILTKFDPSKFQGMNFTFGTDGREER